MSMLRASGKLEKRLFIVVGAMGFAALAAFVPGATAAPWAFVTNAVSANVTVIDTATHTVATTVPVTGDPNAVAITKTAAYVCRETAAALSVIQLPSLTLGAEIPIPQTGCAHLVANRAGTTVYGTFFSSNKLLILNTSTRQSTTIDLPAAPTFMITSLVLSPDNAFLYATHQNTNSITVIRTTPTPAVVRSIPLGAGAAPFGVDIDRTGTILYIAMSGKNAVYAYNLTTDTFVSIPVGFAPQQLALEPKGRYLVVTNVGSQTLSIVDTTTNAVANQKAGPDPFGVDFATDGSFIYVINKDLAAPMGNVSVLRTSGQLERSIPVGKFAVNSGRFIGPRSDSIAVPNVVGQAQAAASSAVVAAGLVVGTVTQQASASVPSGNVISQNPAAGASVAAGSAVNLVVSTGPAPVTVPNVVGQTQAAASAAITAAGLTVGAVTTQVSASVPAGNVISQNPAAGASVAGGTVVSLVVSSGPALISVPNVVGMTEPAAAAAIFGVNLTLGTISTANSETVPSGLVISQSPAASTQVAARTPVSLVISIGPFRPTTVTVPNVVGLTETAAANAIYAGGLTLGSISTAYSATVASGNVISQSPAAHTTVPFQTRVSLVISIGPPIVVVEFYHAPLDHYFITADPNEQRAIDNGSAGPGWSRTGDTFLSDGPTTVCRFYGNTNVNPATGAIYGPNSHFYTVAGAECDSLIKAYNPNTKSWRFESQDFRTSPPVDGGCTASQVPVYRAYNNGFTRGIDSNHRLTPNAQSIQHVVARGWVSEGIVMCAPK